ncbi:major facilitator superfamily domain-containing protein [Naematelia encephala]|uniref:Major facilitator superfamily domain-containing protein n=1 Tax=Naematelia encephala TaxID=71784 RepID=A0A1Y2APZ9_9TREE|nr:major facilitator superfamily domain-containing protein [Naematelia encephala]
MRDFGGLHFETTGGAKGIVLIPQPSASPSDPLNWSLKWKYAVTASECIFTFVPVMSALSLAPMFPLLGAEWNLSDSQLSILTGVCVLALGYANFIIVPCSNIFGRRITSLIWSILIIVTTVWEAVAKSHKSFLGARVLNGFATATTESIMVQIIADIFFIHERGKWTGIYFTSYFLGLFLGPVISGNIAALHGWRSFFWLSIGLSALSTGLLALGSPETRWNRSVGSYHYPVPDPVSSSGTANFFANGGVAGTSSFDDKADVDHIERAPNSLRLDEQRGVGESSQSHSADLSLVDLARRREQVTETPHAALGSGRPSRQQFQLWQSVDAGWKQTLVKDLVSPWAKFFNPIILWSALMVAGPANLLLLWNLTESNLLAAPPYSFSTGRVGYANFAFVVGGLVGLASAGPLSDYLADRATRKNNGVREAEFRLPALIPFCILTAIGIIVGGLGYDRLWSWPIILVIAYGFTGLCVTTVPTVAIAYAVDCYTPISGDIMVVATVLKNTCGFAMSYWVSPLAQRRGMIAPAMVQFALVVGPMLLGIPLYFYGKSLRRLTKNSHWHLK